MTLPSFNYRLVTRSDFDGLVSAALLREIEMIDDIMFVHPKDMQDGLIEITPRDIITNLPYVAACHLCFDHHHSEELRNGHTVRQNYVLDSDADSAARVVYNYFGGAARFRTISLEMMQAVDKCDSARFSREEILLPKRWVLLNFIMDPRTGLGRFRDFRISNYQLMMSLIEYCRSHTIEQILQLHDVRERVELYNLHRQDYCEQIARCSGVYGNVAVIDLREEDVIYCGNRFLSYALLPECNVSVHLLRSKQPGTTAIAVGKSILSRTNPVDVGKLMLKHGGGGHPAAGTCQIPSEHADELVPEIVDALNQSIEVESVLRELAGAV
ncbi:MAG: exopolyphosphatase [Planctomycetaceae bacterium]|nr:exopolyphosphatase [Planctomycetaceae bacterium]